MNTMGQVMKNKVNVYWVVFFSVGVLLLVATFLITSRPKIVVVDLARAIQEPALRLAHSKLSGDEQGKLIARFTKLLPEVIEAYAASHSCTVVGAHVLASPNHLDITPLMIKETIQRLKHER